MNKRQLLINALRQFRILSIFEYFRFFKKASTTRSLNQKFVKQNPTLPMPPLSLMYDAYSHCSYNYYYSSGEAHSNIIVDCIQKREIKGELVICEWGCGPARVIRHIKESNILIKKLIGTDYNQKSISWCNSNISGIDFLKNDLEPPLDIKDHSIDVLYCISVFTHLSEEMNLKWIKEIERVLKPGGLFIGTFQGERMKHKLIFDEIKSFDEGGIIVRDKVKEGSRLYATFHSDNFVIEKLLFNFLHVKKEHHDSIDHTIWTATSKNYI